jgi:hypothetical protein
MGAVDHRGIDVEEHFVKLTPCLTGPGVPVGAGDPYPVSDETRCAVTLTPASVASDLRGWAR